MYFKLYNLFSILLSGIRNKITWRVRSSNMLTNFFRNIKKLKENAKYSF